jgi:hypothetical protein
MYEIRRGEREDYVPAYVEFARITNKEQREDYESENAYKFRVLQGPSYGYLEDYNEEYRSGWFPVVVVKHNRGANNVLHYEDGNFFVLPQCTPGRYPF